MKRQFTKIQVGPICQLFPHNKTNTKIITTYNEFLPIFCAKQFLCLSTGWHTNSVIHIHFQLSYSVNVPNKDVDCNTVIQEALCGDMSLRNARMVNKIRGTILFTRVQRMARPGLWLLEGCSIFQSCWDHKWFICGAMSLGNACNRRV